MAGNTVISYGRWRSVALWWVPMKSYRQRLTRFQAVLTNLTARSMSQSVNTMSGDFPPSSSETFFTLLLAALLARNHRTPCQCQCQSNIHSYHSFTDKKIRKFSRTFQDPRKNFPGSFRSPQVFRYKEKTRRKGGKIHQHSTLYFSKQ